MKSNIGHLEGASGIAAIIKSVLVLEKGIIAPNANFEKLNPQIDGDSMNLRVSPDCVRAFFCHCQSRWRRADDGQYSLMDVVLRMVDNGEASPQE